MLRMICLCFALFGAPLLLAEINPEVNQQSYPPKSPARRDNGYFDYLLTPVFGLGGQALHFLINDKQGLGNEIVLLDRALNMNFGGNSGKEYSTLEDDIVLSFPILTSLFKLKMLSWKVEDVKSKATGLTFGDAMNILYNLSADKDVVKDFERRFDLEKITNSPMTRGQQLANNNAVGQSTMFQYFLNAIERHPEIVKQAISDPKKLSNIFNFGLNHLKQVDVNRSLNTINDLLVTLRESYPTEFDNVMATLLSLKDENGQTLAATLASLISLMNNPENMEKVEKVFKDKSMMGDLELDVDTTKIPTKVNEAKDIINKAKTNLTKPTTKAV